MSDASKFSPDNGLTIYDLKDKKSVHYGEQSKGYVGKNLFKPVSQTVSLASNFIVDEDDYISHPANEYTDNRVWNYESSNIFLTLKAGSYIVSAYEKVKYTTGGQGVLISDSNNNKYVDLASSLTGFLSLVTTPVTFTLSQDTTLGIEYKLGNGKYALMIRKSSILDSTYEPYLTPNTDLMSYADNTILGAKNLLTYPYADKTKTEGGITFTDNGDGSITLNGTSDSVYPSFTCMTSSNLATLLSKYGSLRLTGAINGSNIRLYTHGSKYFIDDGNGVVIPSTETSFSEPLRIQVLPNKTIDNVTIRPMLRLESYTDDTYVPYAMTNRELTEVVPHTLTPHSDITLTAYDCWTSGNVGYMSVNMTTNASISSETNVLTLDKSLFNRTHNCTVYIRNERFDQIDTFFDFNGKDVIAKQSIASGKTIRFTTMFML